MRASSVCERKTDEQQNRRTKERRKGNNRRVEDEDNEREAGCGEGIRCYLRADKEPKSSSLAQIVFTVELDYDRLQGIIRKTRDRSIVLKSVPPLKSRTWTGIGTGTEC